MKAVCFQAIDADCGGDKSGQYSIHVFAHSKHCDAEYNTMVHEIVFLSTEFNSYFANFGPLVHEIFSVFLFFIKLVWN